MKRYVHASTQQGFLSNIDEIDVIVIVNDARRQGHSGLPIVASRSVDEDYDSYSLDELVELSSSQLRKITSFYALDNILTAVNEGMLDYKLTSKQNEILNRYYKERKFAEVQLTSEDKSKLIELLKRCNHIVGPNYRPKQPEKNFAEMHGLDMVPADYLAIIKQLKPSECIGAVKSYDTRRLGSFLYEFAHRPNNYKLKYSKQVINSDITIYIKVLPDYEEDLTVAIISFHDKLDNTLEEMEE